MFKAHTLFSTAAAAGLGLAALPASATPALNLAGPSAMPLAAATLNSVACAPGQPVAPARVAYGPAPFASNSVSKSAAILGGQMSALERMKLQQSGALAPQAVVQAPVALAPAVPVTAIAGAQPCVTAAQPFALPQPVARPTGRFLGTERVAIGRTRFDKQWDRVADRTLSARDLSRALGAVPQDRAALLSRVNRWVNTNIAYRSDGRSDRWADARTTLRKGVGDCEDYAILKLHMLAAAGVAREDMMLTLARDTLRRVDHAVLLVRTEGRWGQDEWVMLDMQSNRVASAALDYGYRPVMSFAGENRFLHGTAYAPRPAIRVAYN